MKCPECGNRVGFVRSMGISKEGILRFWSPPPLNCKNCNAQFKLDLFRFKTIAIWLFLSVVGSAIGAFGYHFYRYIGSDLPPIIEYGIALAVTLPIFLYLCYLSYEAKLISENSETVMGAFKKVLSKKSLLSLLVANLTLLLPYIFWLSIGADSTSFGFFYGLTSGIFLCCLMTLFFAIPSLLWVFYKNKTKVSDYWLAVLSIIGILLISFQLWGGLNGEFSTALTLSFILISLSLLPATLGILVYWYLFERKEKCYLVLIEIVVLWGIFNICCAPLPDVVESAMDMKNWD